MALHSPESDPIHKATIIPRGRALGMVMRLPEGDRISVSKAKLEDDLAVAMGGRIAEEMIFGPEKVTTGASSDIQQATSMAFKMVTEWGMSKDLGPLRYASDQEEVFLGHSVAQSKNMSDATAAKVDAEIRQIVNNAYDRAKKILKEHAEDLEKLAQALLEYELLAGDEIKALMRGEEIVREDPDEEQNKAPQSSVPKGGSLGLGDKDDKGDETGGLPQGA